MQNQTQLTHAALGIAAFFTAIYLFFAAQLFGLFIHLVAGARRQEVWETTERMMLAQPPEELTVRKALYMRKTITVIRFFCHEGDIRLLDIVIKVTERALSAMSST